MTWSDRLADRCSFSEILHKTAGAGHPTNLGLNCDVELWKTRLVLGRYRELRSERTKAKMASALHPRLPSNGVSHFEQVVVTIA